MGLFTQKNAKRAMATTSLSELTTLARDRNSDVRYSVAGNKNTPPAVLSILAGDKDKNVRSAVAFNTSTPEHVLKTLSCDDNECVRKGIASNSNTPVACLRQLSRDPSVSVRSKVAEHTNDTVSLELLAADIEPEIRKYVACNSNASARVMEILVGQEITLYIALELSKRTDCPARALSYLVTGLEKFKNKSECLYLDGGNHDVYILKNILRNPNLSAWALNYLCTATAYPYETEWASEKIASHPNTSAETLVSLNRGGSKKVRIEVAKHPNTPNWVLAELMTSDEDEVIQRIASENRNGTPDEIEHDLFIGQALKDSYFSQSEEYLTDLASVDYAEVRERVARNKYTPEAILLELARDPEESVRLAVAERLT